MQFQIDTTEVLDLAKALEELPDKVNKSILRKAMKDGIETFFIALLDTVPSGPHTGKQHAGQPKLKDSLKIGTTSSSKEGTFGYTIKGNYYGRYVEFGHIVGKRPHGLPHRRGVSAALIALGHKHVAAQPWIRPAFEGHRDRVIAEASQILGDGICAEFAKAARRQARAAKRAGA